MAGAAISFLTRLGLISEELSVPRKLRGPARVLLSVIAVAFSYFFIHISFFGPPIQEIFKGTYLLGVSVLSILVFTLLGPLPFLWRLVSRILFIPVLAGLAFVGLSLTKWVHNAGGVFMITIFSVLILLPFLGLATGHLPSYHPFRTEMPARSLFNLNVLSKMAVGAFAGFEYMAILAGETHSPVSAVRTFFRASR